MVGYFRVPACNRHEGLKIPDTPAETVMLYPAHKKSHRISDGFPFIFFERINDYDRRLDHGPVERALVEVLVLYHQHLILQPRSTLEHMV